MFVFVEASPDRVVLRRLEEHEIAIDIIIPGGPCLPRCRRHHLAWRLIDDKAAVIDELFRPRASRRHVTASQL